MFYNTKRLIQKIFRKYHCSDFDLWSLDYHLAKIILPKLKAYRNKSRGGYPGIFVEWNNNCGFDKNEYDDARARGTIMGGGEKRWDEYLDEMIFAFEYIIVDDGCNTVLEKKFKEKYGDWNDEIPENKIDSTLCGGFYYNKELHNKIINRCENGLKLFGKHFRDLWY